MPQTHWEEKFEEESSHAGLLFIVTVNFWLVFYDESFKRALLINKYSTYLSGVASNIYFYLPPKNS
jgi:hypothetical protein